MQHDNEKGWDNPRRCNSMDSIFNRFMQAFFFLFTTKGSCNATDTAQLTVVVQCVKKKKPAIIKGIAWPLSILFHTAASHLFKELRKFVENVADSGKKKCYTWLVQIRQYLYRWSTCRDWQEEQSCRFARKVFGSKVIEIPFVSIKNFFWAKDWGFLHV